MTFLTRDVGMICWMMMRSFRPSTDSMVARTLLISTPRLFSTLAARPSPSRSNPRSRCSVPIYEWCERSASSWASVRTFFARSVNRSKGYNQYPPTDFICYLLRYPESQNTSRLDLRLAACWDVRELPLLGYG